MTKEKFIEFIKDLGFEGQTLDSFSLFTDVIGDPNLNAMSFCNQLNIHIDKNDADRNNNRMWVRNGNGGVNNTIPSIETYGKVNMPQTYDNNQGCERINPDILKAFKENPYTKSLSSY